LEPYFRNAKSFINDNQSHPTSDRFDESLIIAELLRAQDNDFIFPALRVSDPLPEVEQWKHIKIHDIEKHAARLTVRGKEKIEGRGEENEG
jgi:hypothetical protein